MAGVVYLFPLIVFHILISILQAHTTALELKLKDRQKHLSLSSAGPSHSESWQSITWHCSSVSSWRKEHSTRVTRMQFIIVHHCRLKLRTHFILLWQFDWVTFLSYTHWSVYYEDLFLIKLSSKAGRNTALDQSMSGHHLTLRTFKGTIAFITILMRQTKNALVCSMWWQN